MIVMTFHCGLVSNEFKHMVNKISLMSSIEVYCVWQRAHDSLLSRDCKASMAKSNIHVKINISKQKTLKY